MPKTNVTIKNDSGIHMRVAGFVVQKASQYDCDIYVERENTRANCKSILGIISMGLKKGDKVTIITEGDESDEALSVMKEAFTQEYRVTLDPTT
jgi:phosphocarrier protein HPr